ncbi:P-loop ATPase/GTPase [Marseillevirus marseillevirus]|uniref:P-loop ATPase/GTPase n=1 Tax=Marseillevirus marseillevirus TaxID=694581 RepID=D2XAW8_GBMV|nr:P-loop ATPase/GTPase [Marseillevirus marseillevirus]ADB04095.1 P-loop ATPase/GTPase [Marseillevirus marseillevirus]
MQSDKHIVVHLRGAIGSGKTTYANKLKKFVEENGGSCFIAGTNELCGQGKTPQQASSIVEEQILCWLEDIVPDQKNVLVVDTCGEKKHQTVFGVDMSSWKSVDIFPNKTQNLKGYLSWSLRNVLERPKFKKGCGYWLNPKDNGPEGLELCYNLHKEKAQTLFGRKGYPNLFPGRGDCPKKIQDALNHLKASADFYAMELKRVCEPDFSWVL